MTTGESTRCTAFAGSSRVASGQLGDVVRKAKRVLDASPLTTVLIFEDESSALVEIDFRGDLDAVLRGLGQPAISPLYDAAARGPGRPRLGVVSREVTLLPRHWAWLNSQPGGASVALRKLVEEARRTRAGSDRVRRSEESSYRFMSAMAGDLPGFEEATRGLFGRNRELFETSTSGWPADVREHSMQLAASVFEDNSDAP
ncbi:MAG: DUF2239 family protein [Gemmatimonadaceae bacterium]